MSIKKMLVVAGLAVAVSSSVALAELEVKPYGAVQYRLRGQINTLNNGEADTLKPVNFDYSNRLCWRLGLRAKVDGQLSLQFQIGNDWGAAENVNWNANNAPRDRVGEQNLYVHIASARWNPGFMFLEAGVVPLNSNGTLDMLYSRQARNGYEWAGFNGWGDVNNSMIGIKAGVPIVTDGVKVSAELFQSVLSPRSLSLTGTTTERNVEDNPRPEEIVTVLTVPVDAGDFKITPEFTMVWNRGGIDGDPVPAPNTNGSNHEMLVGANASYKISGDISVSGHFAYGTVGNGGTKASAEPDWTLYGIFGGIGASVKAGPGTLQVAVNHATSSTEVGSADALTNAYTYGDVRYGVKVHDRVTLTPRYRAYHYKYHTGPTYSRLDHRIELIMDASF